ncbi:hypothetical protein QRD89_09485 [Halobacillus sp. ACCC02827]|uniref:hypothetical protein n=1 Tax=Halobacillus sp. ACCC02827 TaxID=3052090 RepID=UPI0025706CDB|nr:hypothetical protein [Halobacillus sp. ACCC02827]WJE17559.1 hypothetical protein QRD89_09485 [Halobacillus sp. ACCC02827]
MRQLLNRSMTEHMPLEIIYLARDQSITQRFIRVIRMDETCLVAYCYTRKQVRTFRWDGILSVGVVYKNKGLEERSGA